MHCCCSMDTMLHRSAKADIPNGIADLLFDFCLLAIFLQKAALAKSNWKLVFAMFITTAICRIPQLNISVPLTS